MKQLKHLPYLLAGIAFLGLSSHAFASPVGSASIANCAGGGFTTSATTVTWLPVAGAGTGCIDTLVGSGISYSGGTLGSGATGTIEDLPAGSPGTFMVLAGGFLDFSLTGFGTVSPTNGVCSTSVALSAGQSCVTSVGSDFLYTSDGTITSVTFTTLGLLTDSGNATDSPYTGVFTTQLGLSTAAIAATIDGGGSITTSYSALLTTGTAATTTTTTPEPATLSLLSTGLALLGIGRRRFGKR